MRLGCDPEIFLADAAGALVSSIEKIGGSKYAPRPLPIGEGFCVQEDNVAIEFNIPPSGSMEEFVHNVSLAREYLRNEVSNMGLNLVNSSAEYFPPMELIHPAAQEFGCDPDFNAWERGKVNPRPSAQDKTLRSAGGHVHVGHEFKDMPERLKFIRMMDLFLGVPSTIMDTGELRKQLYGKAGAFRPKPYGVEYRTLSNFWVFDEKLIAWVWSQTQLALDAVQKNTIKVEEERGSIIAAINENNKEVAQQLVGKYNLQLM